MSKNRALQRFGKGLNPGTENSDQRYVGVGREWRMPILAYLSVVGSLLLGLLFVAEGQFGPPTSLSISTQFHGVPAPWKAKDSTQILTVRDAPIADLPQTALARGELPASAELPAKATVQPALVQPMLETPKKIKQAAAPKKKKIAKAAPKNRNRVAQSGPPPLFGTIW